MASKTTHRQDSISVNCPYSHIAVFCDQFKGNSVVDSMCAAKETLPDLVHRHPRVRMHHCHWGPDRPAATETRRTPGHEPNRRNNAGRPATVSFIDCDVEIGAFVDLQLLILGVESVPRVSDHGPPNFTVVRCSY